MGRTLSQPSNVELVYEPFNLDSTRYNFEYKFDHWFEYIPTSRKKKEIEKVFDRYIPNSSIQYPAKICRESGYSLKTPLIFAKYLLLSPQRPRFLLKDPIALLSAGWLYERYHLKVICMIRNPLAFAGSLKKQGWDFDFYNLLDQQELLDTWLSPFKEQIVQTHAQSDFIDRVSLLWNVLNYAILDYKKRYPEWMFVKHGELAKNPEKHFKKMYDYLDLEFTGEIEDYIVAYTSKKNPTEARTNRYQPRDAEKTIKAWKERLTDEEIERVKEATSEIYKELYL